MNKELLLRVKAHILEEPRRLNMSNWIQNAEAGLCVSYEFESGELDIHTLSKDEVPPCGTVACIAGWACLLSDKKVRNYSAESTAIRSLNITFGQSEKLFFPYGWPNKADYEEYQSCGNAEQRAQIVARVIDGFIATEGK